MYCGCNEKALESQSRIARALLSLLADKPYAEISVSELCREAGVSRPTFYSLFGSMDDVVLFLLESRYCYTPEEFPPGGTELETLCRGYSRYITAQRDFLTLLERSGLAHLLYRSISRALMDCGCFLSEAEPSVRQYAANFAAGGMTGIIRSYVAQEECSSAEMDALLLSLFRGTVFGA